MPPRSVVSMITTLGHGARPVATRACSYNARPICTQTPGIVPGPEIIVDGPPWGKLARQPLMRTSASKDVSVTLVDTLGLPMACRVQAELAISFNCLPAKRYPHLG